MTAEHPVRRAVDPAIQVWAFACIEAIQSGAFDAWLHRIRGAVTMRVMTDEYQDTLVAAREQDEDPGAVHEAFERGPKGVTPRPVTPAAAHGSDDHDGAPNDMYGDDVDG